MIRIAWDKGGSVRNGGRQQLPMHRISKGVPPVGAVGHGIYPN